MRQRSGEVTEAWGVPTRKDRLSAGSSELSPVKCGSPEIALNGLNRRPCSMTGGFPVVSWLGLGFFPLNRILGI